MLSKREATSGTPWARRADSNFSSSSSVIGGDFRKGVGGTFVAWSMTASSASASAAWRASACWSSLVP
jgi:hypothetical protein